MVGRSRSSFSLDEGRGLLCWGFIVEGAGAVEVEGAGAVVKRGRGSSQRGRGRSRKGVEVSRVLA